MTFAWDIPGYVQGHRFSDEPRYWDSAAGRFLDRAGYSHLGNDVQLVAGTPAFSAHGVNNRVGLLLNNTNTYKFHSPVVWEGTMLLVFKPTRVSAPAQYIWQFGNSTNEQSNGHVRLSATGTPITPQLIASTPSQLVLMIIGGITSGSIAVCAFSLNQTDRVGRYTQDGVTINVTSSEPGTNGNRYAIGSISAAGAIPDIGGISHDYVRFGDLVGDGGLVENTTDYLHLFEQHFWKGDVLKDNAPKLATFIASLHGYYGI